MANAGDPPAKLPTFGKTDYWDHRYTEDPEPFDWYQRYSGIAALVHRRARARRARSRVGLVGTRGPDDRVARFVKRDDAVLVPGCGNSRLPEDLSLIHI